MPPATAPTRPRRLSSVALYIGGALGPLGGSVVQPMLPELATGLRTTTATAAASLTVYFLPYAALLLVSGTLGERWGRRRTVRWAFVAYTVASIGCALAPTAATFLAGRAAQGVVNAFTTPLVLAGLSDLEPREHLGRRVGTFAAFQAAGVSLGPFLGGVAAAWNWRAAFVGVAVVAALLTFAPPQGEPRRATAAPSFRSLVGTPMATLCLCGFGIGSCVVGTGFLVALRLRDDLGRSPGVAGVVLVGFGLAGLLVGPLGGRVTDRVDAVVTGPLAALTAAVLLVLAGRADGLASLAALWIGTGAAASLLVVSVQRLTVEAVPANRGGAASVQSAFRFLGSAVAPTVWLPVATRSTPLAFAGAAGGAVVSGAALVLLGRLRAAQDLSAPGS